MISRLSASAAVFAVLATAGLAVAADGQPRIGAGAAAAPSATAPLSVIVMPRVEIIGHRAARR